MDRRYLLRSLNALSAAVSWLALLQGEGRSLDGFLIYCLSNGGDVISFVVDSRSMSSFLQRGLHYTAIRIVRVFYHLAWCSHVLTLSLEVYVVFLLFSSISHDLYS